MRNEAVIAQLIRGSIAKPLFTMAIPMAISLGFGVLLAILITLILVPSFYLATEDLRQLAGTRELVTIDVTRKTKQPL